MDRNQQPPRRGRGRPFNRYPKSGRGTGPRKVNRPVVKDRSLECAGSTPGYTPDTSSSGNSAVTAKISSKISPKSIDSNMPSSPSELHRVLKDKLEIVAAQRDHDGVLLHSNFYKLDLPWISSLHAYSVKFIPDQSLESVKKRLVKVALKSYRVSYAFDGTRMFTPEPQRNFPMAFPVEQKDCSAVVVLRHLGSVKDEESLRTLLYNSLIRKYLGTLGYKKLRQNYIDLNAPIQLPELRLELFSGYRMLVSSHENGTFLSVDITHKAISSESMLTIIRSKLKGDNNKEVSNSLLKGLNVMTTYNRRTYFVDGIDFDKSPASTFIMDGAPMSYMDYYKAKHDITIKDVSQPLLISKVGENRGLEVILIPELCRLVGLFEETKRKSPLIDLYKHVYVDPGSRTERVESLMKRLQENELIKKDMSKWGLQIEYNMLQVPGRVLGKNHVIFKTGTSQETDGNGNFFQFLKSEKMLTSVELKKDGWIAIVPNRNVTTLKNFLDKFLIKAGRNMDMKIAHPKIFSVDRDTTQAYINQIDKAVQSNTQIQMVLVVLATHNQPLYAALKNKLSVELGIPNQCLLAKTADVKANPTIATKLAVQLNAKLLGEPWTVKLPLKNTMFLGFDICDQDRNGNRKYYGAIVASTSMNFTQYFSTVSSYKNAQEISSNIHVDIAKCLKAFQEMNNGSLPDMIFMYRAGLVDGHLKTIESIELESVKKGLQDLYKEADREMPLLAYIVVNRNPIAKLYTSSGDSFASSMPATVVENFITIPQRYNFYLTSSAVARGTASPCHYDVLYDTSGLDAKKMQLVTYKLCHMYFNISATIAVPAPLRYAYKLAYNCAKIYTAYPHRNLAKSLHFL